MPAAPRSLWRRLMPLALVAALLALALVFRVQDLISLDALRERREALEAFVAQHLVAALLIFIAIYTIVVAVSLPVGIYLTLAGGFLFGTTIGSGATWIGASLGAALLFVAARTALGDILRRHAGAWMGRFEAGFRDNAFNYLLALRLLPVLPFWVVNLVPAFFEVKLRDFTLATIIGILPATIVYTSVGAALHGAFAAGTALDPAQAVRALLFSPQVIGPILGLAALALLPVLMKALRKEKTA